MPDFRGEKRRRPVSQDKAAVTRPTRTKPSQRELPVSERRLATMKEAPPSRNKKEHPNEMFRRLLRDFQAGLAMLRHEGTVATVFREQAAVPVQYKQGGQVYLKEHLRDSLSNTVLLKEYKEKEHLLPVEVRRESQVERTIRMPGSRPVVRPRMQARNLPIGDLRRYPGMTGADREAVRQVSARHYDSSPEHLPSAARLAQILRADTLIKSGEGRKDPRIQAWAHAIKSGQRRQIADLNPRMVQAILDSSLGGSTKAAQLLHTPVIERLIERHRANISTIHEQLRQSERAIVSNRAARTRRRLGLTERNAVLEAPKLDAAVGMPGPEAKPTVKETVSHYAREGTRHGLAEGSRPFNLRTGSSRSPVSFPDRHSNHASEIDFEPQLRDMMATNEEAHLPLAQAAEQREMRDVDKPSLPSLKSDRHTTGEMPFKANRSVGPVSEGRRNDVASINVPASKPVVHAGITDQARQSRMKLRLEGEIKISNQGGQQIGTGHAELETR